MTATRNLIVFGAVVIGIAFIALQVHSFNFKRMQSVSAYSRGSQGLSIFDQYAGPDKHLIKRKKAILSGTDLKIKRPLLVLSPTMPISSREAGFIFSFVENGGELVLSFHSKETLEVLHSLNWRFGLTEEIIEDQAFKNYAVELVTPDRKLGRFNASRQYAMYSLFLFDRPECQDRNIDCYVQYKKVGKGSVTLVAGFAPFVNGLIGLADNSHFADELLANYPAIVTDEYHHFFSEKSLADLIMTPQVSLPIIGIILISILYFMFGYDRGRQLRKSRTSLKSHRSFHEINLALLANALSTKDSMSETVGLIESVLLSRLPDKKKQIGDIVNSGEDIDKVGELARLHLSSIKSRMGEV